MQRRMLPVLLSLIVLVSYFPTYAIADPYIPPETQEREEEVFESREHRAERQRAQGIIEGVTQNNLPSLTVLYRAIGKQIAADPALKNSKVVLARYESFEKSVVALYWYLDSIAPQVEGARTPAERVAKASPEDYTLTESSPQIKKLWQLSLTAGNDFSCLVRTMENQKYVCEK